MMILSLYLFPVAKSTEIMMINKTDWKPFADATGSSLEELSTLEGVAETLQSVIMNGQTV